MMSVPHKARGFTLVEIMVAMSLLALIIVGLGATLRTFALSEQRIDQRLERADALRVSVNFIRTTLNRVSVRTIAPSLDPTAQKFLFKASPNTLEWVGIMPARYGAGGRYFFRLAIEPVGSESALVLRLAPWTDTNTFPDWRQTENRVLVNAVTQISFQYANPPLNGGGWTPDWQIKDKLPTQIRLNVQTVAGPWPELTFRLGSPAKGSSNNNGGASFGGGHEDN